MNTNQLLLVSSLGLGVNLFGMFAMGGHHHHVSLPLNNLELLFISIREDILTHMVIHIPRGMTPMLVMLMDLPPIQISQLGQTTTATLIRMSQQMLIPMAIVLCLPQCP